MHQELIAFTVTDNLNYPFKMHKKKAEISTNTAMYKRPLLLWSCRSVMSSDSQNRDQICNTELFICRALPVIMTSRVPMRVVFLCAVQAKTSSAVQVLL